MIKLKDLLQDNVRHDGLTEFFGFDRPRKTVGKSWNLKWPEEASGKMLKSPGPGEIPFYGNGIEKLRPYVEKLNVSGEADSQERQKVDPVMFLKLIGKHLERGDWKSTQYDDKGEEKPAGESPDKNNYHRVDAALQHFPDFRYETKWNQTTLDVQDAESLKDAIVKYLDIIEKKLHSKMARLVVGKRILNKLANISDGERYDLATAGDEKDKEE